MGDVRGRPGHPSWKQAPPHPQTSLSLRTSCGRLRCLPPRSSITREEARAQHKQRRPSGGRPRSSARCRRGARPFRRGSLSGRGRGRPGPAAHSSSREPRATVVGPPVACVGGCQSMVAAGLEHPGRWAERRAAQAAGRRRDRLARPLDAFCREDGSASISVLTSPVVVPSTPVDRRHSIEGDGAQLGDGNERSLASENGPVPPVTVLTMVVLTVPLASRAFAPPRVRSPP